MESRHVVLVQVEEGHARQALVAIEVLGESVCARNDRPWRVLQAAVEQLIGREVLEVVDCSCNALVVACEGELQQQLPPTVRSDPAAVEERLERPVLLGSHCSDTGGGSDLLHVAREYPQVALYANDLDKGIASLWEVIAGPDGDVEALEGLVRAAKPTVVLREEIKRWDTDDAVELAFQCVLVNRTSYSGIYNAGPLGGREQRKTKIGDRWNPERLVGEMRKARALLRGRLRVASMEAVAYLTAMTEEDPGGLFYLDPPYIQQGWQLYREIMTKGDHERLAAQLRRVPNWVLSYDLCPEVERLYSWASINPVETVYTTAKTGGAPTRARRREVVVTPHCNRDDHSHPQRAVQDHA